MKSSLLNKRAAKTLEPEMTDLIRDIEELKSRVESYKGHNQPEIEKAMDDITSALDVAVHHCLDIMEEK